MVYRDFRFIQGLPDEYENGDLIVIDDFMQKLIVKRFMKK